MDHAQKHPIICTVYETLDGKGYRHYHSQQSIRSVERQVRQVLSTVDGADGCTAAEAAEWFAWYTNDGRVRHEDAPFPEGDVLVSASPGRCEGWLIYVLVREPSDSAYRPAMAIKYPSDRDLVFEAAKALALAFDDGCYESVPPPEDTANRRAREAI